MPDIESLYSSIKNLKFSYETTHPEKNNGLVPAQLEDIGLLLQIAHFSAHAYFPLKHFMQPEIDLQKNKRILRMLNQK